MQNTNRLLQVLAITGFATIVLSQVANEFMSSPIFGLLGFLAIPLLFTSMGLFGVFNPRYRRLKLTWGIVTIPRVLLIAGPVLLDLGFALFLLPQLFAGIENSLYAIVLAIAGGCLSLGDLFVLFLGWRMAKDIDLELQSAAER